MSASLSDAFTKSYRLNKTKFIVVGAGLFSVGSSVVPIELQIVLLYA